ncbi:flagellar hook-associated protein 3 FlgL [Fictibacillus solisalsi]|uniref:Flagellar hook-associated protein 3 FlgL n=1 Tax=Fictibacillus solisalsi TaxID=459525 RepID=A0A1G9Y0E8_9BACL|nr:flagellar hook-associated protein FlgL [Fictibacillus solisalsi]SDN02206.1 flagellar hook-associated protein 3 FlgL [Fictibacillus solisalsi]
MRVTQSMLAGNMLRNLSSSYEKMGRLQDQLSTGKKITRASQDPVVAMKGMSYRTNLTQVEQYKRNFSEAYNWVESTDAALDKATSALQRIRELAVQASNGTYEENQKAAIGQEIQQLKEHLATIANTQVSGKYIFNGNDTTTAPVTIEDGIVTKVSGNKNDVKIELSKGIQLGVNVKGTELFTMSDQPGQGLFSDLSALEKALNSQDTPDGYSKEIGNFLGLLDGHITKVVAERAELGAKSNRLELMEDRVDEQEVIASRILSDNEDADIERVITDMKSQESVYRAALGVGSRIIQPSLLDFLR